MAPRITRGLVYMLVAVALYGVAAFFTASRGAFVAIFALGLVIGATADLMFLTHLVRIPWRRRKERPRRRNA